MTAIDFTDLPKRNKAYAGANGNKIWPRFMTAEAAFTRRQTTRS